MTREEAIEVLTEAGQAGDEAFPLLEAAIACAIHDQPFRDPLPVRTLAAHADERLAEASTAALAIVVVGLLPMVVICRQIARGGSVNAS